MLSARAQKLKSSPTLALMAKAKELSAKGHDVISLTLGEPDWPTYPVASAAGIHAIQSGNTKYTAAQGTIEIRKAIANRIKTDLGLDYNPATDIVVTSGAKFSIFAALQVLCNEGDEVIIPTPYWVSYPMMAELAGAQPKLIFCDESVHFKMSAEMLEKNITAKSKVFLFCSPSNPTGLMYTEDELKKIADVLRRHPQICVVEDDMYNRLMFNDRHVAPHLLQVAPDLKNRTIVINGGSKAYSMTGWRIGWSLGPSNIMKAIGDYASQATGAPSSIAQAAAEQALIHAEPDIKKTNDMLKERLESALKNFATIPEFKMFRPDGAFYLWVDIKKALGKKSGTTQIKTSADFCKVLLENYFVSTVPGEEFGHEGYLRLSFAIEIDRMNQAIARIKQMILDMN
ncbi:MAG: pyridoxal phosphate-dependent aminotransferase [Moraxellaceae bacterium]|nr:pyridoxal phosphate-dependent aminotransferase [Pseudobdellovibrionaceae bacterium]